MTVVLDAARARALRHPEKQGRPDSPILKKPEWLRVRAPGSPGYLATKMVTAIPQDILDTKILPQIPMGRLGNPGEVAALVLFLCSDEAGFVTGANIPINGGQHMQ